MKTSTVVFYSQNQQNSEIFRLPTGNLIPTGQCYSHSILLSLAGYMVWNFPYLPVPSVTDDVKPKFRHETFPDQLAVTHPMFDFWTEHFLQELVAGNALRKEETLFFKTEISSDYKEILLKNGFKSEIIKGAMTWKNVRSDLDEEELRAQSKHKNILIISCALLRLHKGDYHSVALIAGLYFNNENWKVFRVLYDQYPSQQEYQQATHIIVPGSHLCLSINIEPQVQRLIDDLRTVFKTNQKLKFLGVCYGHQLLAEIFNPGSVKRSKTPVFGLVKVDFKDTQSFSQLSFLKGVQSINIYSFHNDEVVSVPQGFSKIASSQHCSIEMMLSADQRFFTLQAHPEYTAVKYRSVMSVSKMVKQHIGQDQILQIIKGNDQLEDQSLRAQEMCRAFLAL